MAKATLDDIFITDPAEIAKGEQEAAEWRARLAEDREAERMRPRKPKKYPCPKCGWSPEPGVKPGHLIPTDCRRLLRNTKADLERQFRNRVGSLARQFAKKLKPIRKKLAKLDERFPPRVAKPAKL